MDLTQALNNFSNTNNTNTNNNHNSHKDLYKKTFSKEPGWKQRLKRDCLERARNFREKARNRENVVVNVPQSQVKGIIQEQIQQMKSDKVKKIFPFIFFKKKEKRKIKIIF